MPSNCIICGTELSDNPNNRNDGKWFVSCDICGKYLVDGEFSATSPSRHKDNHLLSGVVRVPKNPIEKMDRLLLSLGSSQTLVGEPRQFFETDYPLAYAHNTNEFYRIVEILRKMGFLVDYHQSNTHGELSYKGWNRVIELQERTAINDQAFVAMPFAKEFDALYQNGIKPALEETGYVPLRVDKTEHNEKIDDYILSQIRKSRILVADFTGQNGGVYFEAGFAMGLGIQVIRTCKDGEEKKLHFDTRQYPHILWETPEDLKIKLVNRINAVASIKE